MIKGGEKIDKNKKKKLQLPFRINIVFFAVFLLFSVLILQLGIVQILQGESFQKEIDRKIEDTAKIPVPRGKIYDRNHNVIVDNKPLYAITYTPPKGVQAEDKLELAEDLAKYLSMSDEKTFDQLTLRNKREYWYLKNQKEAINRLTDEEKEELNDADQYKLALERIKEEEVSHFSDEELEVIAIKKELDKAYALTPQIIKKEGITTEEYARISEHLAELPGIDATTDWEREYLYGDTFKSFIGAITSQKQGIPAEKESYYLSRGYSRNDRIGKSGLEEEYEELLRGTKEQIQYTTTKTGKVLDQKVVVPGERGKDLVLTVDMEFQEKVDKVVLDALKSTVGRNRFADDALAVALNPKTGEVLAASAFHYNRDKNEFENLGVKTVLDSHLPGSTVKGATVLAGFESGVIKPNDSFYDRPLRFADTPSMGSYRPLGSVNDLSALKLSSNVYMFYIALRMGGEYRHPFPDNGGLNNYDINALQDLRSYYNQFGLGVKTGIDYPYEAIGVIGKKPMAGNVLHFAIGQYDTYTVMQMAQYVSTIANDGYRVRPHFVKDIHHPSSKDNEIGPLYKSITPEVLNRIEMDDDYIGRVQEGFRKAFQEGGGTGASYWAGKNYNPAGKTGTAENILYEDGKKIAETENLALVGYAPYDDPEIAFAVLVPKLSKRSGDGVNHRIGTGILDAYFAQKNKQDNDDEE